VDQRVEYPGERLQLQLNPVFELIMTCLSWLRVGNGSQFMLRVSWHGRFCLGGRQMRDIVSYRPARSGFVLVEQCPVWSLASHWVLFRFASFTGKWLGCAYFWLIRRCPNIRMEQGGHVCILLRTRSWTSPIVDVGLRGSYLIQSRSLSLISNTSFPVLPVSVDKCENCRKVACNAFLMLSAFRCCLGTWAAGCWLMMSKDSVSVVEIEAMDREKAPGAHVRIETGFEVLAFFVKGARPTHATVNKNGSRTARYLQ